MKEDIKDGNICKFSASCSDDDNLFPFQFIYETMPQRLPDKRKVAAFCCHLMTEGSAVLETENGSFPIAKGDLFFTFPGMPFSVKECIRTKYLYISYVGSKAYEILESAGISPKAPVYSGFEELETLWFSGLIHSSADNLSMLAKGLLYYTFSLFPVIAAYPDSKKQDIVSQIKSAVDCCYGNPDLSLDYLCGLYRYHPKYISRRFSEAVGTSFSEYLTSCRMYHAEILLSESERPIHEIASAVGYRDALYFSKVFRKHTGSSPSEYRNMNGKKD